MACNLTAAGESRLAMVLKEGDKFPMDSTFQILGEGGPKVSSFHVAFRWSCRESDVARTCSPDDSSTWWSVSFWV